MARTLPQTTAISLQSVEDSDEMNCTAMMLLNNTICMDHPEDMLKPWKANPLFFEIIFVHLTVFIFGLCGNAIVIRILTGNGKARTATNSFLVSLAVGDLLMLCVYGPLETYAHFVLEWDRNGVVCKAAKFAEFLSAVSSVLNLLAVTVERFLVIVFPMKSRTLCTISNTLRGIAGVWLLSALLAFPVILTTGTYRLSFANREKSITLSYCNYSEDSPAFAFYQFFIVFFIPGIIMMVCYVLVIRELWASTRKMDVLTNGVGSGGNVMEKTPGKTLRMQRDCKTQRCSRYYMSGSEDVNSARKQVIKMLILVVFLFYVSWGPRLTMDLLQKFRMIPFTQNAYLLRIIFNVMTFCHSCINPFIYSFMSKNFRSSLLKRMEKCVCIKAFDRVGKEVSRSLLTRRLSQDRRNIEQDKQRNYREKDEAKCSHCSFAISETKSTDAEAILVQGTSHSANGITVTTSAGQEDA